MSMKGCYSSKGGHSCIGWRSGTHRNQDKRGKHIYMEGGRDSFQFIPYNSSADCICKPPCTRYVPSHANKRRCLKRERERERVREREGGREREREREREGGREGEGERERGREGERERERERGEREREGGRGVYLL